MSTDSSPFYQHSKGVPLASKISLQVRRKIFQRFMELFEPREEMTVLDVGVTNDRTQPESNYFEHLYPFPQRITCVGTEDGSHLVKEYPGLKYQCVKAGDNLPFRDRQFDVVFSNAVLEHTGSRESQAFFLDEICRVGQGFFVTTPNRWFPVEHHTGLPMVHFLPASLFRNIIRHTRYQYWAKEENLNILTAKELRRILPRRANAKVESVSLFNFTSNLIAYSHDETVSSV